MIDERYKLYTDAGARGNPGKAAASAILLNWKDMLVDLNGAYLGITTNNVAEYEGLLMGLKLALKHHCKDLICYMDSELVVKQLHGDYKVKDERLLERYRTVKELIKNFNSFELVHVLRNKNAYADKLVNIILDNN